MSDYFDWIVRWLEKNIPQMVAKNGDLPWQKGKHHLKQTANN